MISYSKISLVLLLGAYNGLFTLQPIKISKGLIKPLNLNGKRAHLYMGQ